jgi:hypothetical protein
VGTATSPRPTLQVQPRPANEPRELSFAQERLWYIDQLAPGSSVYNTPLLVRLRGDLDVSCFQRALDAVVQRHEVLRTAFLSKGGRPIPVVLKTRSAELKVIDLRNVGDSEQETEAKRLIKQESSRPFNLTREAVSRSFLFRLGDADYIFLYAVHHIVFEGGSVAILFRDLAAFYNAFADAVEPQLPELRVSYSDFASWQRRSLSDERLQVLNSYWKSRLSGAPHVDLPLDFSRPAVHTMRGAKYYFTISPALIAIASNFFRETGATSYRVLCAAFDVLLHCYTGLTDISLGTPCTPRCRGVEDLIGFFVNTVVLRVDLTDDCSFRKLIHKVDVALHGAMMHSDLPFHKVVEAVQPPRDPSRSPLFQVNFRAPQQPYPRLELNGVTAGAVEVLDNGTAKFDLALEIGGFVGGVSYFEYCTDLFAEARIRQMAEDYQRLLGILIARPDVPISQLDSVSEISLRIRGQNAEVLR